MNKEYKKIYNLVNNLGFTCDYIKFRNGLFKLNIYSKDYNIFKGVSYSLNETSLKNLKIEIVYLIKEYYKNKVFEDEEGKIYAPIIKENELFFFNGVNKFKFNELKGLNEVLK